MSGGRQKHSYLSAFAALCCCVALGVHAEVFTAKVIVVLDGDTIMVLKTAGSEAAGQRTGGGRKLKIRLANIDAPEVGHAGMGGVPPNSQKDQPFGRQSRESLLEMAGSRQVQIDSLAVDQYGRIVGLVSEGSRSINQEQVRRGMAWASEGWKSTRAAEARAPKARAVGNAPSGKIYLRLQDDARQARRGLWAQDSPQPPWQWRKLHPPPAYLPRSAAISDARCGQKSRCLQMTSCDEARFYFTHCGEKSLDANRDGEPCESLCAGH